LENTQKQEIIVYWQKNKPLKAQNMKLLESGTGSIEKLFGKQR